MTKPLEGKVAIITGGARRIGRAMALALAQDGARIVVNTKSARADAEETAAAVEAVGSKALVHIGDVTDEAAVANMVEQARKAFGRVDILINNAAVRADTAFLDMSFAEWRHVTGIVLDGAFLCSKAVLPSMIERGGGRIINIGGVSAHVGVKDRAHVIASKIGLVGFTRALAVEFARQGVTVNCVVPGRIGGERSSTSGKGMSGMPPVGREGTFGDVARLVDFLCQPEQSYITGQTLHVSGGMLMP
jgi:3-oxoacyl-[acyl-carrier protein] reductase